MIKISYHFTEEHKRNLSLALKGIKRSEETIEKLKKINLGRKHTEESKRKMSESQKKRNSSEETKAKLFVKGNIPWCKGLTKETSEKIRQIAKKLSEYRKGKKLPDWIMKKAHESRIGKKHSKETKKKMREKALGRHLSQESIEKIRQYHLGRPQLNRQGSKHPNWKGGITPYNVKLRSSLKYDNWRRMIFKKNNFICIICKKHTKNLNAHHLFSVSEYPNLIYEECNGITLCYPCHRYIHKCINNSIIPLNPIEAWNGK